MQPDLITPFRQPIVVIIQSQTIIHQVYRRDVMKMVEKIKSKINFKVAAIAILTALTTLLAYQNNVITLDQAKTAFKAIAGYFGIVL